MRIYKTFTEAQSEVARDLKEMGVRVKSHSVQDKTVEGDSAFDALEVNDYDYMVLEPDSYDIERVSQPWAYHEFQERVAGHPINPGKAWTLRREVWEEFLHNGQFSYTYSERMAQQLEVIVNELRVRPYTRQAFLAIWTPETDPYRLGGAGRVPCTIGYHFLYRNDALHMTYHQRSCDFVTHYANDIWLAAELHLLVAANTDKPQGRFTHFIGSLHAFEKDVEGVF